MKRIRGEMQDSPNGTNKILVQYQPIGISLPLGTLRLMGGPANAVSVAALPGSTLVVGDQAGQLWEYQAGRWTDGGLGTAPGYAY